MLQFVREEELIRAAGFSSATILRPWYVLGPEHRWPYALLPVYRLMELIPSTRETALRLGLVTHGEMVGALRHTVRESSRGYRIVEEYREIRRLGRLNS